MTVRDAPEIMTVEEAATLLRIGRTAAYEACRRGEIPSLRLGRSVRVPRAGLLSLLGEEPAGTATGAEAAEESHS